MVSTVKIPYSKVIANKVKDGVRGGVSIKDILASIQSYQNAPHSRTTFYKLYGNDIAEVTFDTVSKVGSKVVQQALDGDFKSQELYLRSKGGWSPNSTVSVDDIDSPAEAETSAIDDLMTLLGKQDTEETATD